MSRRRGMGLAVIALLVVLAPSGYVAWAAGSGTGASGGSVTNEDVPTDEAGVVEAATADGGSAGGSADGGDASSGAGAGADAGAGAGAGASNGAGAGVDASASNDAAGAQDALAPDAPINEDVPTDEAGVVEADGQKGAGEGDDAGDAASKPALPALPDPVFGEGVNEDNLVNPQQKPDSSFIYDTAISDLQDADSYLNDQTVQVTGEVIGDRIRAEFDPGYCWIVLQGSDKGHSEIPVFMSLDATAVIDTYGAYGRKGTMLQVRGTFHLICPEHEGLTDLHADTVTFVEKGSVSEQPFDIGDFMPGLVLVAIGFIMLFVFHQMREGQR